MSFGLDLRVLSIPNQDGGFSSKDLFTGNSC
jgi:hypothetical protein